MQKRVKVWVQKFKDRPHLVLQWIDPATNRRKSKSAETADPKTAEAARTDLESDLNNNRYQAASRMTWARFRELHKAEYASGLAPATRGIYDNVFNLFEAICNPQQLAAVTARTVSAFAAGLRKRPGRQKSQGMEPSTIAARLQTLHNALNWAVQQKIILTCPDFPPVRVPQKTPRPVPRESFEKLLDKAAGDPEMRAYLLCGWLAGLRRKEAMALQWCESDDLPWVDLHRNRIVLPAPFAKSRKDQWVPIDTDLREALLSLPRTGKRVFHFMAHKSRNPLSLTGISERIAELAKQAGVKLSMHALRRGFGCHYAGKQPAQILQKLMRHANIKTTMDYYANVDEAVEQAVADRNSSRSNEQPATGDRVGIELQTQELERLAV